MAIYFAIQGHSLTTWNRLLTRRHVSTGEIHDGG